MRNAGQEEAQAEIKIAGRNINNLRYADDMTLMAESEEELESLLKKVKEESEKVGWKLNIQKSKIMASGPITSWEIDGETVADFIFLSSKITADSDCSDSMDASLGELRVMVMDREAWWAVVHEISKSQTRLSDWTELPVDSVVKNLPANAGDMGSIPRLVRHPGEGNGNSLQYSCLGNSMDRVGHNLVTK